MKAKQIVITDLRMVEALYSQLQIDICTLCNLPIKWHRSVTVSLDREIVGCEPYQGTIEGWRL